MHVAHYNILQSCLECCIHLFIIILHTFCQVTSVNIDGSTDQGADCDHSQMFWNLVCVQFHLPLKAVLQHLGHVYFAHGESLVAPERSVAVPLASLYADLKDVSTALQKVGVLR